MLDIDCVGCAAEVYEVSWWMRHYGGASPKRHIMFGSSPWISQLSVGKLSGWKKEMSEGTKPCRTYVSKKDGRKRFCGARFLKGAEKLGSFL